MSSFAYLFVVSISMVVAKPLFDITGNGYNIPPYDYSPIAAPVEISAVPGGFPYGETQIFQVPEVKPVEFDPTGGITFASAEGVPTNNHLTGTPFASVGGVSTNNYPVRIPSEGSLVALGFTEHTIFEQNNWDYPSPGNNPCSGYEDNIGCCTLIYEATVEQMTNNKFTCDKSRSSIPPSLSDKF
ncbi:hypothetical protein MMC07_007839 [Pseudocyphellaria aurata]|nr:hypothetical protein [Pseudocyphellaria aurata]